MENNGMTSRHMGQHGLPIVILTQ